MIISKLQKQAQNIASSLFQIRKRKLPIRKHFLSLGQVVLTVNIIQNKLLQIIQKTLLMTWSVVPMMEALETIIRLTLSVLCILLRMKSIQNRRSTICRNK